MTDLDLAIIILGSLQAMQTAWLHYQTNKNACGGPKCTTVLLAALQPGKDKNQNCSSELAAASSQLRA